MHYGHKDAGIGLNAGDTGLWLGQQRQLRPEYDRLARRRPDGLSYYTPRIAGAQFGASYIPDTGSEDKNMAPTHNDKSAYSMGVNYQSNLGEASVAVSAGYYQAGQTMDAVDLMSGMNDDRINVGAYTANKKAIAAYGKAVAEGTAGSLDALATGAASAAADNKDAVTSMGSKADDKTFTNFGIQVGMGGLRLQRRLRRE